ncbi:MAG: hypothetical protein HETSPECPRED_008130 [Heterodermia speciosa]|uniref:Uncharacterized protein n=1 Tax=Heterodermia speciosa TaxID=116794 RepID=A0A8H3EQF9_9LECA|nr:MAG: hypothetical protein HETSPECPRED_008130 [Heterodermia speciosa]
MHFHPRDNTCDPPYQWFVCEANGFRGCCSDTRVCDLDTCPSASLPGNAGPSSSITSTASGSTSTENGANPTNKDSTTSTPISTSLHTPYVTTSRYSGSSPTVSLGPLGTPAISQGSSERPNSTATAHGTVRGSSKTPLIAGTVGAIVGAVFILVILILIWICLRRKRKAKEEEKRVLGYYVAPGTRVEAQKNGNDYQPTRTRKGRFKAAIKRGSFVSSLTNSRFTTHGESPLSPLSSSQGQKEVAPYSDRPTADRHPELAGTLQDLTPELSSDASFNGRFELPPEPERSLINSPKHSEGSPTKSDHTESSSTGHGGSMVGPNLKVASNGRTAGSNAAHVMSWMNFHNEAHARM